MRTTALGALIAALWIGATLSAPAENIPLPQPAPKKQAHISARTKKMPRMVGVPRDISRSEVAWSSNTSVSRR